MRIENITYHVTDDEGRDHEVTVSFSREYGWQQWGAVTGVLSETMVLTEAIQERASEDAEVAGLLWERDPETATDTCIHCERGIAYSEADDTWIDPEATGDDETWRESCDAHDTFTADHEPGATA